MKNKEMMECNAIIHTASAAAAAVGGGLAQIPCSDNAVIVPIQVAMTISLGRVFGLTLDESAASATVAGATGTVIGRAVSQVLIGWIPGLGNTINATTAAALTESIGWIIANDFEKRSSYSD